MACCECILYGGDHVGVLSNALCPCFLALALWTLACSPIDQPVGFVEIDPFCRDILSARIRDGALPAGFLHDEVRTVVELPAIDGIVAGFPCQDISQAGSQEGLEGLRSSLVFEVLRVCDQTSCQFISLESVAALLALPGVWKRVWAELIARGFRMN